MNKLLVCFVFGLMVLVAGPAVAWDVPDCSWGWNNSSGGVDVTVQLCDAMLMHNPDGSFLGVTPKGERASLKSVNLADKGNQVEYTYLLRPSEPIVLAFKGGHTWTGVFDPSQLDSGAGAAVGNFQVRLKDGTCIFFDVTKAAAYEDGQSVNPVVAKPEEYKTAEERGKAVLAISFARRRS